MLEESQLFGGRSAGEVIRIGDTVRRDIGPHSEFVHSLLKLLEEKHFEYAPKFLGTDEKGREILSFIKGEVSHGKREWNDKQLLEITQIIKKFHDATEKSQLAGNDEIVCHNDIAPWNIILDKDIPVGIIDFDGAASGKRVDDLAYFLWTFLELGSSIPVDLQAQKMKIVCDAYGSVNIKSLIDAIEKQQVKILKMREDLSINADSIEAREFSKERIKIIHSEMDWFKHNKKEIEKLLT